MDIANSGIYNIYIDFTKMNIYNFPNIVFNELDSNTAKIRVHFLTYGEIVDLTDMLVDIKIMNSNYVVSTKSVTVINKTEGYIDYVFEKSDLIYGIGSFQVRLKKDSFNKIAPKIKYKVIKSIQ